jgi:hypothetical protein
MNTKISFRLEKDTFLEVCPNCGSFLIKQTNDSGRELYGECEDCEESFFFDEEDYAVYIVRKSLKGVRER